MSTPLVQEIALTAHQSAHFADLTAQEQAAKRTLDAVPVARNHAALAVIAQHHDLSTVTGPIHIADGVLTFALKEDTSNPAPAAK